MADNRKDPAACRQFLLSLPEDELKRRLLASRHWTCARRDKERLTAAAKGETLDDFWAKEAAEVYYVDLTPRQQGRHVFLRSQDLVEKILECVAQDRLSASAGIAGKDVRRRRVLLDAMHKGCVAENIKRMAAELGVPISGSSRASLKEAEENILIRSCPETERIAVVKEFWESRGCLPDQQCASEKTVWDYLDSALSRRHVSQASGSQLCSSDFAAWEALFEALPAEIRPSWKEDPVYFAAQAYFAEHGSFESLRSRKKKDGSITAEQVQLLRDLRIVRKAIHADQRDKHGHLLRRRLSFEIKRKWEDAFEGAWSWGEDRQKEFYCPGDCVTGMEAPDLYTTLGPGSP